MSLYSKSGAGRTGYPRCFRSSQTSRASPAVDFSYPLVRYLYDAGEHDRALTLYREIMESQAIPPRRDLLAGATLCNLGYLAARSCDVVHAPEIYAALTPLAGCFANTTVAKPPTEHFLGMLAASLGDDATAEQHFAVALAAETKAGAPLLVAETQVEWARLLARSGRDADHLAELVSAVRKSAAEHSSASFSSERRTRWRPVPEPGALRLGVSPRRHRFGG